MPVSVGERRCAICGADIEPGHFRLLHPEYAKLRRMFWTLLGIYFVTLLTIPFALHFLFNLDISLISTFVILYTILGLASVLGPRLWIEKRYRRIWKSDHPLSTLGLRVQIFLDKRAIPDSTFPTGMVISKLKGTDGRTYLGVRLEEPVATSSSSSGSEITVHELAVATRVRGLAPIDELIQSKRLSIPVQIFNLATQLNLLDSTFNLSEAEYLASGKIKRT